MCEDQGMAIASWASLGGGQLTTKEQREKMKNDPDAGKGFYEATDSDIKVCEVLEDIANRKNATLQDIVRRAFVCPSYAMTDYLLGSGIPLPTIDVRLSNCGRSDGGARQIDAQRG